MLSVPVGDGLRTNESVVDDAASEIPFSSLRFPSLVEVCICGGMDVGLCSLPSVLVADAWILELDPSSLGT